MTVQQQQQQHNSKHHHCHRSRFTLFVCIIPIIAVIILRYRNLKYNYYYNFDKSNNNKEVVHHAFDDDYNNDNSTIVAGVVTTNVNSNNKNNNNNKTEENNVYYYKNYTTIQDLPKSCLISSYSIDGIGHQMEAKISCLATAIALNLTYVHQPVQQIADHNNVNPYDMEELFGFTSRVIPILQQQTGHSNAIMYQENLMEIVSRVPQPYIGYCHLRSWFHNYKEICQNDNIIVDQTTTSMKRRKVYSNDNCWDYFWCNINSIPDIFWTDIIPILRQSVLQGIEQQQKQQQTDDSITKASSSSSTNNTNTIYKIVLHMRRGDANLRKTDPIWARSILEHIYNTIITININFIIIIHTDATEYEARQLLLLFTSTTDDSTILSNNSHDNKSLQNIVQIIGRDNKHNISIADIIYDFLTANIFIAAKSALSGTAALLRTTVTTTNNNNNSNNKLITIYPEVTDRSLLVSIPGWKMIKLYNDDNEQKSLLLQVCVKEAIRYNDSCQHWVNTDNTFWYNLINGNDNDNNNNISTTTRNSTYY